MGEVAPTPPPSSAEAALAEALAKMTPGPWMADNSGVWTIHPDGAGGPIIDAHDASQPPHDGIGIVGDNYPRGINCPTENMAGIALMFNTLPAVLASLAAARDRAEAMEARLRWALGVGAWTSPVGKALNWEFGTRPMDERRAALSEDDGTPEGRWQATLAALDQARTQEPGNG